MSDQTVTVLRAKGVLDVDLGEVLEGATVVIEGNVVTAVTDDPTAATGADQVIDLPDLTLVPGPHGHGGRPGPRRPGAGLPTRCAWTP